MGSVGSGAWADWVVEADLAHYIDAREMPADWEHPFFPMRAPGATISAPWGTAPSAVPTDPSFDDSMAVRLDTGLVNWAFALTVDTPLADSAALRASRAPYAGYPQALRPPFVLRGDNADAQTYWSGKLSVEWCRDWVRYWTGGQGTFATSAMEDSGVMRSLRSLDVAGKVDVKRALVLRTASNYAMQPDGVTAAEFYFGDRAPSGALDEGASPFEVCTEICLPPFLVFFLCASRACLGKPSVFNSKRNSTKARPVVAAGIARNSLGLGEHSGRGASQGLGRPSVCYGAALPLTSTK